MYIITNINQNTPEWHKWRSQGIGGSDANIIMGVSEYSNIIDLWNLKTGKTEYKDNSNFLTRMGHQAEEWARGLFEYESGFCFPSVLGQDEKKAWMRISYDGYNKGANEVWECKLLGEKPFEILKEGKVPEKYYPQVQYQMHVPKADHNYLYGVKYVKGSDFRKTETYCLKVDYNAEYCHDLLEPALDKFWENVQNNTMPEPDNNSVLVIQDSQLKKDLALWHRAKKKADEYAQKEKEAKVRIFENNARIHTKILCGNYKVIESVTDGRTDYKSLSEELIKIITDNNLEINIPDISKFKKDGSIRQLIKRIDK